MTGFSQCRVAARTCVVDADAMVKNYYRPFGHPLIYRSQRLRAPEAAYEITRTTLGKMSVFWDTAKNAPEVLPTARGHLCEARGKRATGLGSFFEPCLGLRR